MDIKYVKISAITEFYHIRTVFAKDTGNLKTRVYTTGGWHKHVLFMPQQIPRQNTFTSDKTWNLFYGMAGLELLIHKLKVYQPVAIIPCFRIFIYYVALGDNFNYATLLLMKRLPHRLDF